MILAVDPGGTTGVARWQDGFDGAFEVQRPSRNGWLSDIDTIYAREPEFIVVCESFQITARTSKLSQQHDPLEIIGVLRFLSERHDFPLIMQQPSEAKRFATDHRLKNSGFWAPTPGGHANDACRHLFVYQSKRGIIKVGDVDAGGTGQP